MNPMVTDPPPLRPDHQLARRHLSERPARMICIRRQILSRFSDTLPSGSCLRDRQIKYCNVDDYLDRRDWAITLPKIETDPWLNPKI